jgi:hypothetical protein
VSLATGSSVSDCFQIAYYCVRNSRLHPRFINMPPFHSTIALGEDLYGRNQLDPLAVGMGEELGFHKLTLTLLKASWKRAQRLVGQRRTAIVKVAEVGALLLMYHMTWLHGADITLFLLTIAIMTGHVGFRGRKGVGRGDRQDHRNDALGR